LVSSLINRLKAVKIRVKVRLLLALCQGLLPWGTMLQAAAHPQSIPAEEAELLAQGSA